MRLKWFRTRLWGEKSLYTAKRAAIEAALPHLHFLRIGGMFYGQSHANGFTEVEEFTGNTGVRICSNRLPATVVAGNRVANGEEIWLHPDGSLHKYHWTATWETEEAGCSQRLYMVPASEVDISLEDLMEAIECNRELVPLALKTTYK